MMIMTMVMTLIIIMLLIRVAPPISPYSEHPFKAGTKLSTLLWLRLAFQHRNIK